MTNNQHSFIKIQLALLRFLVCCVSACEHVYYWTQLRRESSGLCCTTEAFCKVGPRRSVCKTLYQLQNKMSLSSTDSLKLVGQAFLLPLIGVILFLNFQQSFSEQRKLLVEQNSPVVAVHESLKQKDIGKMLHYCLCSYNN